MYVLKKYVQQPTGMHILSREDIEEIATETLKNYSPAHLTSPLPFDTVDFMENHLGLTIKNCFIGGLDSDILGMIVMTDMLPIPSLDRLYKPTILEETFGTVLISSSLLSREKTPRRRYTEAHEAAHFILHKDFYDWLDRKYANARSEYLRHTACRIGEPKNFKPRTDSEWREWQADKLAAALLMPKGPFIEHFRRVISALGVQKGYLSMERPEDVRIYASVRNYIADTFVVSRTAAEIRMKNLNLLIA